MQHFDENKLDEWCTRELQYWSKLAVGKRNFENEFERLNATYHTLFVLDIRHGSISIRPKPAISGNGIATGSQEIARINYYKVYIESSLSSYNPTLSTTIAIDVHDLPICIGDAPIFCFQKTVGSTNLLLPDVDFMQHGWYEDDFEQPEFRDKRSGAIFVGSSTGGGHLSSADVINETSPRLRLGRAFLGSDGIAFTIAAAVQCDSPETETLLRNQPYFGPPISWEEQLQSKFLISVDGNGATCSRVVNSLRSKSILMKFSSNNMLFYFHGLDPWRHYIPVDAPTDVEEILERERNGNIDFEYIVEEANRFFSNYLTKSRVELYGAKLLKRYALEVARKEL